MYRCKGRTLDSRWHLPIYRRCIEIGKMVNVIIEYEVKLNTFSFITYSQRMSSKLRSVVGTLQVSNLCYTGSILSAVTVYSLHFFKDVDREPNRDVCIACPFFKKLKFCLFLVIFQLFGIAKLISMYRSETPMYRNDVSYKPRKEQNTF